MMKTEVMSVRVDSDFKEECRVKAANVGMSLSDWFITQCGGIPSGRSIVGARSQLLLTIPVIDLEHWRDQASSQDIPLSNWVVQNIQDVEVMLSPYTHHGDRKIRHNDYVMDDDGRVAQVQYMPNQNTWLVHYPIGDDQGVSYFLDKPIKTNVNISVPWEMKQDWKAQAKFNRWSVSVWVIAMLSEK